MNGARQSSFVRRLFETKELGGQSPAARFATYFVLVFWTLVVLVPLYWVLVTTLKIQDRRRRRAILSALCRLRAVA